MCKNHAIASNFMGTACRYKSVEGGAREKLKSSDRVKTTGGSVVIREPSTMDDPANYTCSFAVSDADGASLEATIQLIGQSADGLTGQRTVSGRLDGSADSQRTVRRVSGQSADG